MRLPAAGRLTKALLGRIERGEYEPGEWLPTERELAAEFRADRTNIRAALAALAEKQVIVRQAGRRPRVAGGGAEGVGAAVGSLAESLTLAALTPMTPQYSGALAVQRGALHMLRQKDSAFRLAVSDTGAETLEEGARLEAAALAKLRGEGTRGVILWHLGGEGTAGQVRELRDGGIPVVLVDRRDPALDCDFVGIDNSAAAYGAVAFLLDMGHRRIAHLTTYETHSAVREREQGWREALTARGICARLEWVFRKEFTMQTNQSVTAAAEYFLSLPERPTAIFAMNDGLAHAMLAELQSRGIKVPEEMSVMGFDDVDRHSLHPSPLTTVRQPFEQIGKKAMELLLKRIAAPEALPSAAQHVLLQTELVVRNSCGPKAAG